MLNYVLFISTFLKGPTKTISGTFKFKRGTCLLFKSVLLNSFYRKTESHNVLFDPDYYTGNDIKSSVVIDYLQIQNKLVKNKRCLPLS